MSQSKILVIEDEKALRNNISEMLELSDFQVEVAANGVEGLKKIYDWKPDIILCDVMMPEMDGFEVLFNLRQSLNNHVPFIFLTARVDRDDTRKGMNLGADDYLTKPFSRVELLNAVNSRLDLRRKIGVNQTSDIGIRNILKILGSQETNTPLNGIIGFGEYLKNHPEDIEPEAIQQMGGYIKEAGEKIFRMSKKLSLYEGLASNSLDSNLILTPKEMGSNDLRNLIETTVNKVANDFNRTWDVHFLLEQGSSRLDRYFVQFIVSEIADNAFRYSLKSHPVFIRSFFVEDFYVVNIKDEGYVSGEEHLERIRNIKAFSKTNPYDENLGLGIYLCNMILKKAGGSLEFLHNMPKGLEVTIKFPANKI
jgi:DNA-binding response OmpR family regulator/anti-sigma regulatory factor (Ser/Thr protein kinase)